MTNFQEKLKSIRSLGCTDEAICFAAYHVYVHLTEEKNLHDVQCHYAENLREIYLTAKKEPNLTAPFEVFIPTLVTEELDFSKLSSYRKTVKLPDGEKVNNIVIALCDSSSTVLLYNSTPGLRNMADKKMSKSKLVRQQLYAVKGNK